MAFPKYERVLGIFTVIAVLLGLIFLVIVVGEDKNSLDFKYPEELPTQYISLVEWPPQVQITEGPFTCLDAGAINGRVGRTELRKANERNYCVTEIVEGAAGSMYTQYFYAFENGDQVVTLTFTTRATECGNYPPYEMEQCSEERAQFNMDLFVDEIVREAN